MSNPYELSDKNEEELSRITAKIRQSAYQEGYAEGYKDGLARFVPEVDTVPIPKAPIEDSPAEWAKGDR